MTANKPMTAEQMDELMTVAVNMQRDSEKAGDRPAAMFAYAVQVAVLELRKVRDDAAAMAAENAGLKSGVTYFAFAPEYGFDYFTNKQDAIDTAQAEIDAYRDDAFDGWDEDVRRVSWGVVIQQADGFDAQGVHISDSRHTYQTCDYQLVDAVETPATDAFMDEVRASGVDGAINCIKTMMANTAPAHHAVGMLNAYAAQLRKGVQS